MCQGQVTGKYEKHSTTEREKKCNLDLVTVHVGMKTFNRFYSD